MASLFYNEARKRILADTLSLSSATIKVVLVTASYTPNKDHVYVTASGVGTNEINVTGYTPGWGSASRKSLASKTFNVDNAADEAYMDAADVSWTALAAGATIAGAVLVVEGGADDSDSLIIGFADFTDTATNGQDFTVQWPSNGVLALT